MHIVDHGGHIPDDCVTWHKDNYEIYTADPANSGVLLLSAQVSAIPPNIKSLSQAFEDLAKITYPVGHKGNTDGWVERYADEAQSANPGLGWGEYVNTDWARYTPSCWSLLNRQSLLDHGEPDLNGCPTEQYIMYKYASYLMPKSAEYVAALFMLFWDETHPKIEYTIPSILDALPATQTQLLGIYGSNFLPTSKLRFSVDTTAGKVTYPPIAPVNFRQIGTTTALDYNIAVGTSAATWTVEVINDGSIASNAKSFTVRTVPAVPVVSLPQVFIASDSAAIILGQSATLGWASDNAGSCVASGGWTGARPLNGNEVVTPTVTTTYALACTNATGVSNASKTITVIPAVAVLPAINSVSPLSINALSPSTQTLTILGSGFSPLTTIGFTYDNLSGAGPVNITALSQPRFISATEIQYDVTAGIPVGIYTVAVANGGLQSRPVAFNATSILASDVVANVQTALTETLIKGNNNASLSQVTSDLYLPSIGVSGTSITWSSTDTAHIATNGIVTRPLSTEADAPVTLTATLSNGSTSSTKVFNAIVLKRSASSVPVTVSLGSFSGQFVQNSGVTSLQHPVSVGQDGSLVLNISNDATLANASCYWGSCTYRTYVYLYRADGTTAVTSVGLGGGSATLTASNLAAGAYYIGVLGNGYYGAYSIQANFTPAVIGATETESNDTPATANLLGSQVMVGSVGYINGAGVSDAVDYYKYVVSQDGRLVLNISNDATLENVSCYWGSCTYSTHVYLYRADGTTVVTSVGLGGGSATLTASNLSPGTYYVMVPGNGYYGAYSIQANFTPAVIGATESEPNDTPTTANLLGSQANGSVGYVSGSGVTDTSDYYKYVVSQDGRLLLNISNDATLANSYGGAGGSVTLYRADGTTVVASVGLDSRKSATLTANSLAPGTYYIGVSGNYYYGAYSIQANFTLAVVGATESEPNDTPTTANLLGSQAKGSVGYINGAGVSDTYDYYKYVVSQDGRLVLNISYDATLYSCDYYGCHSFVTLYRADGTTAVVSVALDSSAGGTATLTANNLAAGTYYVRVSPSSGAYGAYSIQANFTPAVVGATESEPNDTPATANLLGSQAKGSVGYINGAGVSDAADYYKYVVSQDGRLVLNISNDATLANSNGGAYVILLRADGTTQVTAVRLGSGGTATLTANLAPGTYYVKVDSSGYYGAYSIQANFTVIDTTAPTTSASPAGGTFNSMQSVTLTCSDGTGSGCDKIYYTTDGTTPTTASTVYSTAISISTTKTLKFFASDLAGNSETVKTATYTIDTTAPVFTSTSPASNSFINTATVGYTLSEAVASGKVTFTWAAGTADPSSPHVYNLAVPDMTAGTHNVNTGLSLVNSAIYTVTFEATDLAGNMATPVSGANVTFDTNTASVTINAPASGSIVNNTTVTYALSKDISGGDIVFTRTGGSADTGSPRRHTLSGGELTGGSHTINTGLPLVSGAVYSLGFENVTDKAGNITAAVTNINITFDSTAVAITATAPAANGVTATAAVSYTLSEAAQSGKVTFTRTGGSADAGSPHVYALTGNELAVGLHTVNTNFTLVDNAFYTVSFDATDIVGNSATTVSNALVFFDNIHALTLTKDGTGSGTITSDIGIVNCGITCSGTFNHGATVTLTATPDANYAFTGWSGGCTGTGTCAVTLNADTSVTATFALNSYTIAASAGANGSISPSGNVTLNYGAAQTFTLTPAANYHPAGVVVDGLSVGNVTSYTFNSVTAGHTITASFAIDTHAVTASAGSGGTINPGNTTVTHGSTVSLTVTPNTGYHIASVTGCGGTLSGNAYTTGAVAADCAVSATFMVNDTQVNLATGWNLLGNSVNAPLTVAATFGNAANVSTVWKWIPATSKWAFYTPSLADGGAAYATTKGYDFLTAINGGEGFWVNAKVPFTASLPAGTSVGTSYFQDQFDPAQNKLVKGWNLIATGDNVTPSVFNAGLSMTPPAQGVIPPNVTTLWAWDSGLSGWYFYAPSLEASNGLANYITTKGYLNFGAKMLDPAMGFWVNRP